MRTNLMKILLVFALVTTLFASTGTYARHHHDNDATNAIIAGAAVLGAMAIISSQQNTYDDSYYGPNDSYYYQNSRCAWVSGHYDYDGYWTPAHRECW